MTVCIYIYIHNEFVYFGFGVGFSIQLGCSGGHPHLRLQRSEKGPKASGVGKPRTGSKMMVNKKTWKSEVLRFLVGSSKSC